VDRAVPGRAACRSPALANPPALVELFAETITEELDFRLEAQNMLDIARLLREAGQTIILVPRPHPELVTRRVLVMERLSGFKYDDSRGLARRRGRRRDRAALDD
jgi:ubiquinone biosynthesis protein